MSMGWRGEDPCWLGCAPPYSKSVHGLHVVSPVAFPSKPSLIKLLHTYGSVSKLLTVMVVAVKLTAKALAKQA